LGMQHGDGHRRCRRSTHHPPHRLSIGHVAPITGPGARSQRRRSPPARRRR
jgi:hypothetical protein